MALSKKLVILLFCLSLTACGEGEDGSSGGGFWSSMFGAAAGSVVGNAVSNKLQQRKEEPKPVKQKPKRYKIKKSKLKPYSKPKVYARASRGRR